MSLSLPKLEWLLRRLAPEHGLSIIDHDGRYLLRGSWDGYRFTAHRSSDLLGESCAIGTLDAEELAARRGNLAPAEIAYVAIQRSLERVVERLTPMPSPIADRDPGDEERAP